MAFWDAMTPAQQQFWDQLHHTNSGGSLFGGLVSGMANAVPTGAVAPSVTRTPTGMPIDPRTGLPSNTGINGGAAIDPSLLQLQPDLTKMPVPIDGGFNGGQIKSAPTDWNELTFAQQFGRPSTPQELIALEPQLQAQGIKVLRNAEGTAGKIQLPSGQIVDVINAAGAGGRGFQWLTGGGSIGGGQDGGPLASLGYGGLLKPFDKQFSLPTADELKQMPGYQAGLDAVIRAGATGGASRGLLNTGRFREALNNSAQDYAAQQYANLAGLKLGEFNTNYGIFKDNQDRPFSKLTGVASLGR